MGQAQGKDGKGGKSSKGKLKTATKAISHASKKMSEEDSKHQHFHYRFRQLGGDPLLLPSGNSLADIPRKDKLSTIAFDALLASRNVKGVDEDTFVDTFSGMYSAPGEREAPGFDQKAWEKVEKKVIQIVFLAITRTTKKPYVNHETLTLFLNTVEKLPEGKRRTRTRELRTWFAQNVDGGLSGKMNMSQFYSKIMDFKNDGDPAYENMMDGLIKKLSTYPKTFAEDHLFTGDDIEGEEEPEKEEKAKESKKDPPKKDEKQKKEGLGTKLLHWTSHFQHHTCKFPFKVVAIETYKGNHSKTELSFKQGDVIHVSGECMPDGTKATDVPREPKRVRGIMDVNYPVYDPKSTKCWIGELTVYTADPDHYATHKIGHFPISKVAPKLGFEELEEERLAKREEELHDKAEHGDATFSFGEGPIGLKFAKLSQGVIVDDVEAGSPADKYEDICEGDLLLFVNETKITEDMELKDVNELIAKSKRPFKLSFQMGDEESTDAED